MRESKQRLLDNQILFKRLEGRNYSAAKVEENVQCEIFQMIAEEARQSYKPEIVFVVRNDTPSDIDSIANDIVTWVKNFTPS